MKVETGGLIDRPVLEQNPPRARVKAAFDDSALSEAINDRIIDRCLDDMSS